MAELDCYQFVLTGACFGAIDRDRASVAPSTVDATELDAEPKRAGELESIDRQWTARELG